MWHNRVLEVTHANNGGASKRNVESNVTALCGGGRSRETTFLGDGGRGGQRGWPFATYVSGGVKCRNEC